MCFGFNTKRCSVTRCIVFSCKTLLLQCIHFYSLIYFRVVIWCRLIYKASNADIATIVFIVKCSQSSHSISQNRVLEKTTPYCPSHSSSVPGRAENVKKSTIYDDVIKWKHFPLYWPFVRGIHRSLVNSTQKGQ